MLAILGIVTLIVGLPALMVSSLEEASEEDADPAPSGSKRGTDTDHPA